MGEVRDRGRALPWMTRFVQEGSRRLEEEAETRAHLEATVTSVEARRAIETIDAAELFEGADEVGRTLLYAVAKFPGLQPHELERLMDIFLAERTLEVEEIEDEVADDPDAGRTVKRVRKKRRRPLVEFWKEAPDGVLAACQIQAVEQEDGRDVVDFVAPYLRRDLVGVLRRRHPLYLRQRLDQILDAGLLFEGSGPPESREGAIAVTTEIAFAEPGRFGGQWLSDQFGRVDALYCAKPARGDEAGETGDATQLPRGVLAGLSDLIREMLRHDRLRPLVESWFEELLRNRQHRHSLRFALDVLKTLRFTPQFDVLHWFKRLLDEAPEDDRAKVYDALLESSVELGPRIYDLLELLSAWLPDPHEDGPGVLRADMRSSS